MKQSKIHIGTSGWHYDHWKGPFYPGDMRADKFLDYYAHHFTTAEINNSFYQLPAEKTFLQWKDTVPGGFLFSVKASRYLTHMKKLKDPGQALMKFLKRVDKLENKLGPILFQLPPRWHFNGERLQRFLRVLPDQYRYAFEFRDESWFNRECYELLDNAGVAFCIYDLAGLMSPKEVTSNFVYIRLHGPGGAYQGRYDRATLSHWAKTMSAWVRRKKEIFCYFDNDEAGYAALNALELQKMIK